MELHSNTSITGYLILIPKQQNLPKNPRLRNRRRRRKNSISDLIDSLDPVDPKDYDTTQLNVQISADFHLLEDILAKLEQVRKMATANNDSDRKLAEFKKLLLTLKGKDKHKKVLVFSYFKDTAEYVRTYALTEVQQYADYK